MVLTNGYPYSKDPTIQRALHPVVQGGTCMVWMMTAGWGVRRAGVASHARGRAFRFNECFAS